MKVLLIMAAVLGGWAANARDVKDLTVCTAGPEDVDRALRQAWQTELSRILAVTGHRLVLECRTGAVEVHFHRVHAEESSALGSARTSGGAVLPKIELYLGPVAELIGTRLSGPLGIALARITAHELAHYLTQERGHAKRGAFGAYYTAGVLLGANPRHFRLPVAAGD